jgi:hypothetical protein
LTSKLFPSKLHIWQEEVTSAGNLDEYLSSGQVAYVIYTASIGSDLSIFELWATLSCGGTVVLADDLMDWWEHIDDEDPHPVRLINTLPSAMTKLIQTGFATQKRTHCQSRWRSRARECGESVVQGWEYTAHQ